MTGAPRAGVWGCGNPIKLNIQPLIRSNPMLWVLVATGSGLPLLCLLLMFASTKHWESMDSAGANSRPK